ncbi:MAG TPA: outer membrane beta-barrel protein [Prolixibacteraceae bacterium]|nr:outer membrane beta-barrel protein [Prolixibacteraceae bacterium]
MKQVILSIIAVAAFSMNLKAQEISADTESLNTSSESFLTADTIKSSEVQDTAIVRIGKKEVKVIDHGGGTEILWGKDKHKKDGTDKFNGHWEGIELGFNGFDKADYSMYDGTEFMSLNQGKSIEFNINFYELNISLSKSNVGLVSGFGLSFNNYRFENPYTLLKGVQRTEAVPLDPDNLSKTKLALSYLNVPLLLEFQIPVNQNEGKVFINAGLIGGVMLGSHTKVKHGDTKDKDRSGFNLNSFKYAATARIGYKDISLFATYSLTPLFQSGKGPELTPFTIGISFMD